MPLRSLPYFRDRVCRDAAPSEKSCCTSATRRSPSVKKVRIWSSSSVVRRRRMPPGRFDGGEMQDCVLFGGDVYFPAFGAYFCDSADNEVANLWFVATCQRREDTREKMLSGLSGYRDLSGLTDRSLFTRWTVLLRTQLLCHPRPHTSHVR